MRKSCQSLNEHAMKIINFVKKKMNPLRNKQKKSHKKTNICCIWGKKFQYKYANDKKYLKVRDHCYCTGE